MEPVRSPSSSKQKKMVIYKKHAEYTEYVPCCNQSSHKAMYTAHAEGKKRLYIQSMQRNHTRPMDHICCCNQSSHRPVTIHICQGDG
jgi:hypothetical protein